MGGRARPRRAAAWNPPAKGGDVSALFAILVAFPLLLPLLSGFGAVLFILPALVMALNVPRCLSTAARRPGNRLVWRTYALAAVLGFLCSAVAAASLFDDRLATPAFYLGFGASACFLAGLLPLIPKTLKNGRTERLVDALIFNSVVGALSVWLVAIPGYQHGDPILTSVFVVDLVALGLAAVPTLAAAEQGDRHTGWWLVGVCASSGLGDGFVAAGGTSVAFTAIAWAAASVALLAATSNRPPTAQASEEYDGRWFVAARIVLPLLGVLAFPVAATVLSARGDLTQGASVAHAPTAARSSRAPAALPGT